MNILALACSFSAPQPALNSHDLVAITAVGGL